MMPARLPTQVLDVLHPGRANVSKAWKTWRELKGSWLTSWPGDSGGDRTLLTVRPCLSADHVPYPSMLCSKSCARNWPRCMMSRT